MRKQLIISSKEQADEYIDRIIVTTNSKTKDIFKDCDGITLLKKVKFIVAGYDPLFDEPMNFVEQVNQTFTYLVCLKAVKLLLESYSGHEFLLNLGTEGGYDVVSEDGSIICECFASTTPDSNKKLESDAKKVYENKTAVKKYVVFYTSNPKPIHVENIRNKYSSVEIIPLDSI